MRGLILDKSNTSIEGANLSIEGRESVPFKSKKHGAYFRLLMPGTYTLNVSTAIKVTQPCVIYSQLDLLGVVLHSVPYGILSQYLIY